jgi:hypothetical protein
MAVLAASPDGKPPKQLQLQNIIETLQQYIQLTLRAALLKTMLATSSLMSSAKQKCLCVKKRIKIAQQSKKQLKFES